LLARNNAFTQKHNALLFFLWNNRHFPIWLFANAFGLNLGIFPQFHMNDPSLACRHGFKHLPPAGMDCLIRHPLCQLAQLTLPPRPEPLHINPDPVPSGSARLPMIKLHNVLDGVQGFRSASNQDAQIIT